MECWAVLGINQTADTAVIRKAYKQQLLICHPEDDPAGYQRVRKAYTAAMNAAKLLTKAGGDEIETEVNTQAEASTAEAAADADIREFRRLFAAESVDFQEDDSSHDGGHRFEKHLSVKHNFFAEQEQVLDKKKAENDFMARLEHLINNQGKRNDPEAWKTLLSDDVLWDIPSKSRIDDRMLRLFSKQYSGLSDNIWVIIESHTGLFDKINRKIDDYPASFVDTYALATQNVAPPRSLKKAKISAEQIVKKPDISGWRYCFRIPVAWIVLMVIGNVFVIPVYILSVLVRFVLFVFRRNWKIIMWEYTFTYINRWGKCYDFKYIDIIKVAQHSDDVVIVYLKGKRIIVKTNKNVNAPYLLARLSRY
ncbi:J domain-containing protein [Paenibacillus gorillae]|uniref:J domain-containing protein n=1 Tax=Paenibacillus gorillae TaxID=1243662 RepID=UPI0004BCDAD2|nr:J domain-containing protein [Paenibacillus gorillae]